MPLPSKTRSEPHRLSILLIRARSYALCRECPLDAFSFCEACQALIREYLPTNAILLTTIIHTIGIGESHIDQLIGNLEQLQKPHGWLGGSYGQRGYPHLR